MKRLIVDIENCYGIKKLQTSLDLGDSKAVAIYAPNGSMKTSLAQTFQDVSQGTPSRDRIFPARTCKRNITDEKGNELTKEAVLVVRPYDEVLGHSEKTSTLLVNQVLRKEYEQLHVAIDACKDRLLKSLKKQSSSKKDLEREISAAFTPREDQFYVALGRIKGELQEQKDAPFADVKYDVIFDDKVLDFLDTEDFKVAIEAYITRYNELLDASTYFRKGIFSYYNAAVIAKQLADNGFFRAKHSVSLNAAEKLEITTQKQLEDLIAAEKDSISKDKDLKAKFAKIDKLIQKNVTMREFEAYLATHEELLAKLANIAAFREELWKSYLKANFELYQELMTQYEAAETRKKEIEELAKAERTQWEDVIDIFNDRFSVPFTLTAVNKVPVTLGQEAMLALGFTFTDGNDTAPVERAALMQALSQGERKALYILNVIFEIEARKKAKQETLLIIDDIADSFDYKNKYAIIQYLKDISDEAQFGQIILTHNFDFFRIVCTRFVGYNQCYMASRTNDGITLSKAAGIKNVFVNDWKPHFFDDAKKRVASIPFLRNLIEFMRGEQDQDFVALTSLLHWKANSHQIRQSELDGIYNRLFGGAAAFADGATAVVNMIRAEAGNCLTAPAAANFENKIVLAIAIRLAAEEFMAGKINDPAFVQSLSSNQSPKLLARYVQMFPNERATAAVIQRVILMTPENIHLNAFMYEPILDMSDDHLRKLYRDISALT
jgi:hypothetical protein